MGCFVFLFLCFEILPAFKWVLPKIGVPPNHPF